MNDPRVRKLAELLVGYSMAVKEGEGVLIIAPDISDPLSAEIAQVVAGRGGFPFRQYPFVSDTSRRNLPDGGKSLFDSQPDFLKSLALWQEGLYQAILDKVAAVVSLLASDNTKAFSPINAENKALFESAFWTPPLQEKLYSKKWVVALFPTEAFARDAGMLFSEYADFFYAATTGVNWPEAAKEWGRIKSVLDDGDQLAILAEGTELKLRIGGRSAVISDGRHNMPSGEVYTSAVEDSAQGVISFSFPAIAYGREVEGIRLVFEKGEVIALEAKKGEEFLAAMVEMDAGPKRIGEVGFGTNPGITRFTKQILLDEKIAGTIHLALGMGYPQTLSQNKSGLHWDMICDLRQEGEIILDGKVVQRDGEWLI